MTPPRYIGYLPRDKHGWLALRNSLSPSLSLSTPEVVAAVMLMHIIIFLEHVCSTYIDGYYTYIQKSQMNK